VPVFNQIIVLVLPHAELENRRFLPVYA